MEIPELSIPFLLLPRFNYQPPQLQTSFGTHPNSDPGANVKLHLPLPLYSSTCRLHLCQSVLFFSFFLCYLQSQFLSVCVLASLDNLIKRKKPASVEGCTECFVLLHVEGLGWELKEDLGIGLGYLRPPWGTQDRHGEPSGFPRSRRGTHLCYDGRARCPLERKQ